MKKSVLDVITSTVTNTVAINQKSNTNTKKIKIAKKESLKYTDDREVKIRADFQVTDDKISAIVEGGDESGTWVLKKDSLESTLKKTDSYSKFTQTSEQVEAVVQKSTSSGTWVLRADSVMQAIKGATENKTILDTNGFHVSGGAFDFKGYDGDMLIEAVSNGSVEGIRIGDSSWDKDTAMRKVMIVGLPFDQYLTANLIFGFAERVEEILRNHNLIS